MGAGAPQACCMVGLRVYGVREFGLFFRQLIHELMQRFACRHARPFVPFIITSATGYRKSNVEEALADVGAQVAAAHSIASRYGRMILSTRYRANLASI